MKAIKVIISLLVLMIATLARCGTADLLFLEANSHYEKGNYADAERLYRKILDYGIRNEVVYYNLGNACFKQNRLGEAVLFYEKALKLKPGDLEIEENLELANLLKYDRVEEQEPSPPLKLILWFHDLIPLSGQLLACLVLFYLLLILLAFLTLRMRRALDIDLILFPTIVIFLLLAILTFSAGVKIYHLEKISYGIVLKEKVDVMSGPGETNAILFPIHEGLKVRVRNSRDAWYQISLPNGLNGWIRKETIGII
ncbi:MAG: tetratricopeptide repeat protein [Acidobacteriota bacterium]